MEEQIVITSELTVEKNLMKLEVGGLKATTEHLQLENITETEIGNHRNDFIMYA